MQNHLSSAGSIGESRAWGGAGFAYHGQAGWRGKSATDRRKALKPLILLLEEYDRARLRLENQGGSAADFSRMTGLLKSSVSLETDYGNRVFSLAEPQKLQQAIRLVDWDYKIQIRQLSHRMPVYYIGRTREDWWAEYSLLVEDVYQSLDYPIQDERFLRLMHVGHEVYYLRVAHLRDMTAHFIALKYPDELEHADRVLYDAGRHVFQHAWHEDQRLAILLAQQFGLPYFQSAIELLYLLLSADLCDLRSAVSPVVLDFFDIVYPQPAIGKALKILCDLDGQELNELPRQAIPVYKQMTRAFGRFLKTEVAWKSGEQKMPLWKLIYANLGRLDKIGGRIDIQAEIKAAKKHLEAQAGQIIETLLDSNRLPSDVWLVG